MTSDPHRRSRIALWFESTRRPGLLLFGVVLLLYGRTLPWGFVLDDLRHIRVMQDFHEGKRDTLGLYRFLTSPEDNRAARTAGWYTWWLADDVRYQHWRPVSEWMLYGEFLVFGENALGYRIVTLVLYAVGAWLALNLFRAISGDERLSRWSALIFTVMAGHAVPVVFVAAQPDSLSLVLACGAMWAIASFLDSGGAAKLFGATLLFAASLGSKEASLSLAIMPLVFLLVFRSHRGATQRAWLATAIMSLVGLIWLSMYVHGGYGANSSIMLDPVHAPLQYLQAMPARVLMLLSALIIPINPFLFYLRPSGQPFLIAFCIAGAICLIAFATMVWRHHRRQHGITAMALWIFPFLPLLACTVPDDRVLVLPSLGFAFLAAAWMIRPRENGLTTLRRFPFFLFIIVNASTVLFASQAVRWIEQDNCSLVQQAASEFGRDLRPGDHLFFLNDVHDWQLLFVQLCLEHVVGRSGATAAFLTDAASPVIERIDERKLRIHDPTGPLLAGFFGDMGKSHQRPKRAGDVFDAGEYKATITEAKDGAVKEVEIEFRQPLESDAYRFYFLDAQARPQKWVIPQWMPTTSHSQ